MTHAQKQRLEQQLWKIANELRGKMGADEFRDYILGFIFYKYLSEKQHLYANKLLETESIKDYAQVTDPDDIDAIHEESLLKLGYFLRPDELFSAITAKGNANTEERSNFILEDLQAILNSVEQSTMGTDSEDDFNKLFEDLDLSSTKLGRSPEARNNLIARVLAHLDRIDFELEEADSDVLGDAYEYLIAQFASGAGKKAGEFYTPQQVSKILAKIVTLDKQRIKSAYDPTCGSGSLLLRIAKEAEVGDFYGQELNRTTYNLARMNMILHDVHFSRFDIRQEDTLEHPQHLEERFEAVVANPPFSAKWKGKDNPLNETDDRFSQYGRLAPGSKADFAFVQHLIYQMAENATMAVVLPHGVLFRGAAEGIIRQYIIKDQNFLDAVIGLPANLFYGTTIPACILVLKKCRVHDDNILFIDASQHFQKSGNQNTLTNEHVQKIIETYQQREGIDKYAYVASLDEVAENNYNLNVPRYVDTFEEEEPVDIETVSRKLKSLELDMQQTDATIVGYCKALGAPIPKGFNLPLLKQYKKGIIQKLFSQEIRFKDEQGNNYSDWKEKRLGDIGSFRGGGTPNTKIKKYWIGDIPWISSSDLDDDSIHKITISRHINSNAIKESATKVIPKNSILIVSRVGVGKFAVSLEELCTSQDFANFTPLEDNVIFLAYWLSANKNKLFSLCQGTSIKGLTNNDLSILKTNLPILKEQQKIADFLSAIDQKIELIGTETKRSKTFKKGLLQ